MNSLFSPQRTASGQAIYAAQVGSAVITPTVILVAGDILAPTSTLTGGALEVVKVFIDEPAPHPRCVFMDTHNRTIRL